MHTHPSGNLPIPQGLAEYAAEPDNDEWREWIAALPDLLAEASRRWSLTVGQPYEPGGMCSWVAPAENGDGAALALKLGTRHYEAEHEIEGLHFWDGDGAIRLYDFFKTETTCVLLMERCEPGHSLKKSHPEPEQDEVIAGLLQRLHREPPPGHPFRSLQSMCDEWGSEFARNAERFPEKVAAGLVQVGLEIFRSYAGQPIATFCSVQTCTRTMCWPRSGSRGWPSIPSPMWATQPTTRPNICSTARIGWMRMRRACAAAWER